MRVPDMQPVQPPPTFIGTASPPSRYSPRQSGPASTTVTSTTTTTPTAHTSAPSERSETQVQHPPPPTDDGDDQVHQRARWPHGLRMQRDFITRDHEAELVRLFREELEWPARGKGRVSLHYGYTFSYKTFGIDEDVPFKEFPGWLRPLIPLLPLRDEGGDVVGGGDDEDQGQDDGNGLERVVEDGGRDGGNVQEGNSDTAEARNRHHQEEQQHRQRQMLQQRRRRQQRQKEERRKHAALGGRPPDQVCLQYYPPGTGIPPHVDTHSTYDELYALSLGAPVLMQFRLDGVLSASSAPPSLSALLSGKDEDKDRARDRVRNNGNDDGGRSVGSGDHDGTPGQGEAVAPIQQHQQVPPPEPEETTLLPPKPERAQVELDLLPRSMLEMSGDSRLHWTHGIKPRKTDTLTDHIFGLDSFGDSSRSSNTTNAASRRSLGARHKPRATAAATAGDGDGDAHDEDVISAAPALLPPVVRPREDRWSITYRWLRKEVPAPTLTRSAISGGEEAGSNSSSHREGREADSTTTTTSSGADFSLSSSSSPRGHCGGGEMVRECECGDVLLCDTAQRRRGQEREYRWKQYDAAA